MYADIHRYVSKSARVDVSDIDWSEAAEVGLTEDEAFVLTYFSAVENQSIRYLRTLLGMKIAFQPEVSAFLATWNYEEFFHGYEIEQLMLRCGRTVVRDAREQNSRRARFNERLEELFIPILSHLYREEFPAVYMAFGAIQELTTLRGYESLAESTKNPALRLLSQRIAKQERRHFAWYYNSAHELLARSKRAQRLVQRLMRLNWVPVGAGIHDDDAVDRLFRVLFYPHSRACAVVREIDAKVAALPGLSSLHLMESYFAERGLV